MPTKQNRRPGQCKFCPGKTSRSSIRICAKCDLKRREKRQLAATPQEQLAHDRDRIKLGNELAVIRGKYNEALKTISQLEANHVAMDAMSAGLETFRIRPRKSSGQSEGTVVVVASDWHIEERVGAEVGGLNTYTLEIARARVEKFFQSSLRLTRLLQKDISIDTMVLALLGDFITGNIHGEENAETNQLLPVDAVVMAEGMIVSGIQFLLDHSRLSFVIPCHSGNHARTTKTTHFSAENGHSLEFLMFKHLADHFRGEKRVRFVIPEGMHSYLQVYDQTIRFQHGHAIKYGGGVGGIYIPVNKAIAQWSKARHADLDVFGHFHQARDGGNFICNGSVIGYNGFALSIKADFEQPKQQLFLMDKRRGRTCTWPVLVQ